MKIFLTLFFAILITTVGWMQADVTLELFKDGFSSPIDMAHAGDERLFVVEQGGSIKIIAADGTIQNQPFLNINSRISSSGGEQGLLGLAFHPDYINNRFFYVNYTAGSLTTRISRFTTSADNPDEADPDSEVIILEFNQPFNNHNGGDIAFGPDGFLYIGTGDGGSGGDPQGNSQNRQSLLGKMLRIDVTTNTDAYTIPSDNPFVNDDETLDEIWALGLRNPWRYSFDQLTGDLWNGDVGQSAREEINFQAGNSAGGENYGWNCREGIIPYINPGSACNVASGFVEPAFDYTQGGGNGCSVTGGFVYRGCAYPELYGNYVFADFCSGRFWTTVGNPADGFSTDEALDSGLSISAFGEDINNELYAINYGGQIYRVQSGTPLMVVVVNNANILSASTNGIVASYQWNLNGTPINGANMIDYTPTETGDYSVTLATTPGCSITSESVNVVVTGIETLEGLTVFDIYPSPFKATLSFNVTLEQSSKTRVSLLSQSGKVIQEKEWNGATTIQEQWDTQDLTAGVYLIKLETEKGSMMKKVLKF